MADSDFRRARQNVTAATIVAALLATSPVLAADVVTELQQAEELSNFASAMMLAGFGDEMRDDGPYTIFVPTDVALAEEGTATLLNGVYRTLRNRARLVDLVSYHIVLGEAVDVTEAGVSRELIALNGESIQLECDVERSMINGQIEIVATTEADNGVIHRVSGLLWPLQQSAQESTEARSELIELH